MAELASVDYAFLAILKVEGRELSNTRMEEIYQVRLVRRPFERLLAAEYIVCDRKHRPYRPVITDKGLKALAKEFAIEEDWVEDGEKRSLREKQLWAGMVALQKLMAKGSGPTPAPVEKPADLDDRIRGAYRKLAGTPGEWVNLAALRPLLRDVPKADVDKALTRMIDDRDVRLEPDALEHRVSAAERKAAVHIGGEDRHKLAIGRP